MSAEPRRRRDLPELELACMNVLWDAGELTVRGVRDRLAPSRRLAYTTVLTVLDRLSRKGAVNRRKHGRAFHYEPAFSRSEARQVALSRLIDHYFGGSRQLLVEHLSTAGDAARAESGPAAAVELSLDPALL